MLVVISRAAHHALTAGAHPEPRLAIRGDPAQGPWRHQVLVSLPVFFRDEFRHRYSQLVLNCNNNAGFKPVLLILVLIRVFDGHFYCQDGFSDIHSLGVYACAVEGRVEASIVII